MEVKTKKGRKPIEDKKRHVALYVKDSDIKKLDGIQNVQEVAYTAIKRKVKYIKNNP